MADQAPENAGTNRLEENTSVGGKFVEKLIVLLASAAGAAAVVFAAQGMIFEAVVAGIFAFAALIWAVASA